MDPVLAVVVRGALALLFAVAALHKLRSRDAFGATLDAYAVLPHALSAPLARAVPVVEIAAAVLLVTPRAAAAGGALAAMLLAIYALAMGVNLLRGRRDLDCGCMGPGARSPIGPGLIVRNALLIAVALVAGLAPVAARPLVWLDVATV
ncbi:methylamine utilization protein MauE, partial [Candidatus Binatia bacterium]|nr:methylamine utilization protein MauE [Candidatus Binatia bacterium]